MISTGRLRARLLLAALVLLLLNAFAVLANRQMALAGDVDFRALYAAGALVRTGHAPGLYHYDTERQTQNTLIGIRPIALPFLYPPYAALPFVPLSLLPYRAAYLTFLALNVLLLAATARLLGPSLPALRKLWPPIPFLLFLCFLPVPIALFQGQVSIVLLLLLTAAFIALEDERPFLAGLLLALALIKFHVVLPVLLLFLVWKAWSLLTGFFTGAAFLTLLSIVIAGPSGLRLYADSITAAASTGAIGDPGTGQNAYNLFATQMPNLHGIALAVTDLFGWTGWTSASPPGQLPWPTLLALLLSAAVLLWTALQPPSLPRALVAGLLVSYHLHLHDLTLLLLPLSLVLDRTLGASRAIPTLNQPATTSSPSLPSLILTVTALLWLLTPLHLLLMATGWKSLFAPLMLPLLLPQNLGSKSPPASQALFPEATPYEPPQVPHHDHRRRTLTPAPPRMPILRYTWRNYRGGGNEK